ncbi:MULTISPECIES: hypothetical protein [Leclercia]|uniref:hypothetical protein n=1 Tax=Leclercia TaxID=83654 RepID=UPI001331AD08|nr:MULTISPECIES: hypothetical protein [Leclercia]
MDKVFDILNGWLVTAVSSGVIQVTQVLLFIAIISVLALLFWKIRSITALFNAVRNSKINEYQRLLNQYELHDKDRECLNNEIKRIIRYRTSGISDVARQKIVWMLLDKNKDIIPINFFKKFRSFLEIENNVLVFKKGVSYWIENGIYFFYSLQFLFLSILCIVLAVYRSEQIPVWGQLILYSGAGVTLTFFIAYAKMIPRAKECTLLNEILNTQHDITE